MAFDPVEEIKLFHGAINALDFQTIENYFAEVNCFLSQFSSSGCHFKLETKKI